MKKGDISFVVWIIVFSPVIVIGVVSRNIRLAYLFGSKLVTEIARKV